VMPYRSTYRRYWQTGLVGDAVPDPEEFGPAASHDSATETHGRYGANPTSSRE